MLSTGYMKPFTAGPMVTSDAMPQTGLRQFMREARALHDRERARMRAEVLRIPGLMALLMKPRNGERWSAEDRALLRAQLRGLGVLGLYLTMLAIPGTTLTLPLLAWWLDRRRVRRDQAVNAKVNTDTALPRQ